jgi:tetratricopeptide (TPR) repeat protein
MLTPASRDDLLDTGNRAFDAGAFAEAAACFAEALVRDPADLVAALGLGCALMELGDPEGAAGAFARGLEASPTSAALYFNLGVALRALGDAPRAAAAHVEAIALGLDISDAFQQLGRALADDARLDEAAAAYRRALALAPERASLLVDLGNVLADAAEGEAARACYERALALDPQSDAATLDLFAALHDDDPAAAERLLDQLLARSPRHPAALFHRGALLGLREGRAAAAPFFALLPEGLDHLRTSFEHVVTHRGPRTRLFTGGFRLLDHALAEASLPGLVIELGVRRGASLRFLAARCEGTVHGFDSFEGLPESWRGVPRGAYSTRGELPDLPSNVALHAGWFAESLPPFLAAHPGPVRFLNVDCDLYASTRDALAVLAPRLVPGSVLVFDEYLANPGWEDDEHRALEEAAQRFDLRYEWLAFSFFSRQAAVVIR